MSTGKQAHRRGNRHGELPGIAADFVRGARERVQRDEFVLLTDTIQDKLDKQRLFYLVHAGLPYDTDKLANVVADGGEGIYQVTGVQFSKSRTSPEVRINDIRSGMGRACYLPESLAARRETYAKVAEGLERGEPAYVMEVMRRLAGRIHPDALLDLIENLGNHVGLLPPNDPNLLKLGELIALSGRMRQNPLLHVGEQKAGMSQQEIEAAGKNIKAILDDPYYLKMFNRDRLSETCWTLVDLMTALGKYEYVERLTRLSKATHKEKDKFSVTALQRAVALDVSREQNKWISSHHLFELKKAGDDKSLIEGLRRAGVEVSDEAAVVKEAGGFSWHVTDGARRVDVSCGEGRFEVSESVGLGKAVRKSFLVCEKVESFDVYDLAVVPDYIRKLRLVWGPVWEPFMLSESGVTRLEGLLEKIPDSAKVLMLKVIAGIDVGVNLIAERPENMLQTRAAESKAKEPPELAGLSGLPPEPELASILMEPEPQRWGLAVTDGDTQALKGLGKPLSDNFVELVEDQLGRLGQHADSPVARRWLEDTVFTQYYLDMVTSLTREMDFMSVAEKHELLDNVSSRLVKLSQDPKTEGLVNTLFGVCEIADPRNRLPAVSELYLLAEPLRLMANDKIRQADEHLSFTVEAVAVSRNHEFMSDRLSAPEMLKAGEDDKPAGGFIGHL